MNNRYFYRDKPIFGLDIGFNSIKVMQVDVANKQQLVRGYGVARFDSSAVHDGEIVKPETIAKAAFELFDKHLVGSINTRRVAVGIPAARTFNRNVILPKLRSQEINDALRTEAEQYIPLPVDELYMDYDLIHQGAEDNEYLAVAVPKRIVDSYLTLLRLMDLEPVVMETSISAASRLFNYSGQNDIPTVLIDFGSVSSDITIYDKTLVVTGTVPGGGDVFTELIAKALDVNTQEALIIKTKYGLSMSKKQKEIIEGLTPVLDQLIKEIRRMVRYYEERGQDDAERKIGQIVTIGGGANMPGLAEYLTNTLRMPVRMSDPWQHLKSDGLQLPNSIERTVYATVAGLALIKQQEITA